MVAVICCFDAVMLREERRRTTKRRRGQSQPKTTDHSSLNGKCGRWGDGAVIAALRKTLSMHGVDPTHVEKLLASDVFASERCFGSSRYV
jgi:hypothetical protein